MNKLQIFMIFFGLCTPLAIWNRWYFYKVQRGFNSVQPGSINIFDAKFHRNFGEALFKFKELSSLVLSQETIRQVDPAILAELNAQSRNFVNVSRLSLIVFLVFWIWW